MNREDIILKQKSVIDLLFLASESEISPLMLNLISKWSNPPKPFQVLEVIERCVNYNLAKDYVIDSLKIIYEASCALFNKSKQDVEKPQFLFWRDDN